MINLLSAINRIAFTVGDIDVAWYGIIIVCGMLLGLLYLISQCSHINLTTDDAIEYFLWLIPLAVVFARILYVIVRPEDYFPIESWDDFVDAIAIWDGGITIIGGILGGLIGTSIFSYRMRKKANFGQILDLVIVPLLIGQIIGRLGNFINQEAFGKPIMDAAFQKFPFAIWIDNPSGVESEYADLVYSNVPGWFAATFFYEMCWNTIGAMIFFLIWRKNKKYPGILGICYFFWYFLGRGLLEFIRIDALPITQIACFVLVPTSLLLGLAYIFIKNSKISFRRINDAVTKGTLSKTELSLSDVKNYRFATKWLAKSSIVAWKFYGVDKITVADLNDGSFIVKEKKKAAKTA